MDHSAEFLALVEAARANVREVTVDDIAGRVADRSVVLVDVREDREWDAGHARGAVHLGRGILERDVVGLYPDKDTELVLYCGGGFRSALSAENLQKMGYTRVSSLIGGWRAWNARGLPVDT